MKKLALTALLVVVAAPAMADEKVFNKCKACHSVIAADGTEVVKGGKTGPNLFGVIGRPVASVADYDYGDSIKAVGASGKVWDEASLVTYIADPSAWLAANGAGEGAKSKMTFKLAKDGEEIAAWLATQK
ncbi:MAG: cytochrome C [Rhodobacteraceae bacterium]|nr:cytochrome C [Paracoccaceae bacterium]